MEILASQSKGLPLKRHISNLIQHIELEEDIGLAVGRIGLAKLLIGKGNPTGKATGDKTLHRKIEVLTKSLKIETRK